MAKLREEYNNFLKDIEKNLKNKEDLEYVKVRFSMFVDKVIDEMDMLVDYKTQKMSELEQKQKEIDDKMSKMQQIIDNIEKDIYSDDGFDFEIICPYCDNQFVIDVDEDKTEVECPVCNNIIELDWSGDVEEDSDCHGSCSGCHGCDDEPEEEQQEDEKQLMQSEDNKANKEENNDDDM